MPEEKEGGWLSENIEPGQTFSQFLRTTEKPLNLEGKKIYIKPIGVFDTNQVMVLKDLGLYLGVFYQCEVVIEEGLPIKIIPKKAKRKHEGFLQLNTAYINYKILYPSKPKDAIAYLAITTSDLYPSKDWNFVFGRADQLNKVGVSSIARYNYPNSVNYNETLSRIIKTSAHEIGHMMGIEHCISASCLMNGSNSLKESDSQPQVMCSECFVKLAWRTEINLLKRDSLLLTYFNKYQLDQEYKHVDNRKELVEVFLEERLSIE
jgi:archaemetzincin